MRLGQHLLQRREGARLAVDGEDRLRRADPGNDILALRIEQVLAL